MPCEIGQIQGQHYLSTLYLIQSMSMGLSFSSTASAQLQKAKLFKNYLLKQNQYTQLQQHEGKQLGL